MAPERLGKYDVLRKIASGGMSEVWLCRLSGDEGFEKKVAVKVDLDGNIVYDKVPYASQDWQHAAKCIELCHRVHEVGIKDNMERLEHALESL